MAIYFVDDKDKNVGEIALFIFLTSFTLIIGLPSFYIGKLCGKVSNKMIEKVEPSFNNILDNIPNMGSLTHFFKSKQNATKMLTIEPVTETVSISNVLINQ